MAEEKFPPIHVLSIIRGFRDDALPHQITPFRFETRDGRVFRIQTIRQFHRERVGKGFHYHYVIQTREKRFFHLIFDTQSLVWRMIQEIDEELFFHE